jgi:hypothetical protein
LFASLPIHSLLLLQLAGATLRGRAHRIAAQGPRSPAVVIYGSYDEFGQARQTDQTAGGHTYTFMYQYNLVAGQKSVSYPRGGR